MTKWTKEQEEAIYKTGTNIIVSAGAGSGKTAVLTERVLEKVKNGTPITSLLILTFTKMAAKEMRERIGSKLKKEELYDALNDLDKADITTFDAYSLSLVKKYHYILNIPKNINIIDESVITLYKRKVLTNIFNKLYSEENKEFLSLIRDYYIKDDKELFDYILMLNSKLDLKSNKSEYLDCYIDKYFNDEKISNDISIYENYIFSKIDLIREYLEYIDDSGYLDKLNEALSSLFMTKTYDDVKDNIDIKLPRAVKLSDTSKLYKEKISNLLKEIKDLCLFDSTNEIRDGILKTRDGIEVIIDIINRLDKEVSCYKEKYGYYEYFDIANMAIKLVKENNYIREEIKNNLNEILIDEYQDTNDIQEEFISYIANNNVYMVGDIKQSIYRFRNANPYIFKNKYEMYSRNKDGYKIDLNKNFRSREEVINNINLVFEKIMDEDLGGAAYQKSHKMIFGNTSYNEEGFNNQNNDFEIYSYDSNSIYSKEEIEAFIIAKDIKNKINNNYQIFDRGLNQNRKIDYSDFAILIDKSKNFELFKKILEYNDVPCNILKDSSLTDGNLIVIIKNIIDFIIKIKDNVIDTSFKYLFMSIGRSFLFEVDDNILFNYFKNNNFYDSDIYKISKKIADNIDNFSLTEFIDVIINDFDVYNKLFLIGDYKENTLKISKLRDIVINLEGLNYDVYSLNEYLNGVIENGIEIKYKVGDYSSSAVKIMTIHASKGLEYGVVYFASLYNRFNIREAISKLSYDESLGIIIPYKKDFIYNTIYHNISYKNYVRENIGERIRLFYVALTRAREKMILLLPKKEINESSYDVVDNSIREKYKSFADFLYSINDSLMKYYKDIDIDSINLSKKYNLIKKGDYKELLDRPSGKIEVNEVNINNTVKEEKSFSKGSNHLVTLKEKRNLEKGTRLHELFEFTDFKNVNYSNLDEDEISIIDNFIKNIDLNYLNAYKEYEFIYDDETGEYHGIIDLMLEYDDYIDIIDYKLKNIKDDAYIKQLGGYKSYIEKLFDKKVNIYLYSIIDNNLEKI